MNHQVLRLREIDWGVGYSSDECDLLSSFYEPAMGAAIRYNRAVGYFSSSALALISKGIQNLYLRNGRMRLIASPVLSVFDRKAISKGYETRGKVIEKCLLEYLDPNRLKSDEYYRLQLLTGMIADGLLEVRIAVKEESDGSLNLYHEKVGVFIDETDDYMTFIGSPNESWNGWVGNAESFALHKSWDFSAKNAEWESSLFDRTWERRRKRVPVYDFPNSALDKLFEIFPPRSPDRIGGKNGYNQKHSSYRQTIKIPDWLQDGNSLYDFQRDAVNSWLDANGRGVFAMATGTGKTVTALVAATQLIKEHLSRKIPLLVLVVVPSSDLVTQWYHNATDFGFSPACCHALTSNHWPSFVSTILNGLAYGVGSDAVEMIIVTADTLVTPRFKNILSGYSGNTLLIGDEIHSLGTTRRLNALPDARYRLGLSATPRRHGDEEGTDQLLNYFGDVLQRIDIKRAIELKALVPYRYEPILVPLDVLETERYKELSLQIAVILYGSSDHDEFVSRAGRLLLERARIIGHAKLKLPALRCIAETISEQNFNLVYVAEDVHPIYETRQLDEAVRLIGVELGMKVNTYTSETPYDKRKEFQEMLRDGRLQALIAMRCLDEGIDIPEARRGLILASTQNPRQFVQRRGRILRRYDKGGKTEAELYDFLVVPSETPPKNDPTYLLDRRLVGRELTRSLELASASMNWRDSPPDVLIDVMKRYDLFDYLADYNNPTNWEEGGVNVYGEGRNVP